MAEEILQSAKKAFLVLERLAKKGAMGVRELSADTGLSVTATHRILNTLVDMGYGRQQEITEKYELTYKLLVLGHFVEQQNSVVNLAHPQLVWLSRETSEAVHLAVRSGGNVRYIDKVIPTQGMVSMGSYVGMEIPMYSAGLGKAILAELSPSEVQEIWNSSQIIQYTDKTITTLAQLERVLEEVRRDGVAYDHEEREIGTTCIAASILDVTGKPIYALSISGSTLRMQGENMERNCKLLLETKERLSALIGVKAAEGRPAEFLRKNRG